MTDITLPATPLPTPHKDAPIAVASPPRPPAATLRTDDRPQRRFGILVLLVSFGGFAAWSALAPIGSAAVAPGVVTVESARKTVQNLAGGFVEEILVREGDQVSAGQLLVRLDDTEPKAQLEMARGNYIALIAEEARLIAERDGNEAIRFPPDLLSLEEDDRAKEAMAVQQRLFQSRRTALKGEMDVQTQRIEQLQEQIKGYEGLIASKEQRSDLYDVEIKSLNKLFQKGFSDNSKLREWERLVAELDGEKSEHQAEIASARLRITETELQILQLERNFNTEVATRLQEVQPQISDQRERVRALGKTLERTEIRAPVAGAVVSLTVHTEGGVIKPGQDILGVVPKGDSLIVEAHVSPNDIDRVSPGLSADIRFTAFNVRTTPIVSGRVLTVSGDRLEDPATHQPYYLVRIQVPEEGMAKLQHINLVPGMSATVMINTGEQTLFGYLIKPISDRLATALRED